MHKNEALTGRDLGSGQRQSHRAKVKQTRAVVVAQLADRLLLIPKVHGSNPVIGKNLYIEHLFIYCQLCLKDENKEKEAGYGPI